MFELAQVSLPAARRISDSERAWQPHEQTGDLLNPIPAPENAPFPFLLATKIFLLMALLFIPMAVITPVLQPLVQLPFDLTKAEASSFLTVNGLATLFLSIPMGLLSDYLRIRVPFLVVSMLGNAVCIALLPIIPDYNTLLIVRFVQGVFDTTAQVMIIAWAFDIARGHNRVRVIALVTAAIPVAYLIGPFMAQAFGAARLPQLFLTLGYMLFFGAMLCIGHIRDKATSASETVGIASMMGVLYRLPILAIPIAFGFIDKFTFSALATLTGLATEESFQLGGVAAASGLMIRFWLAFIVAIVLYYAVLRRLQLPNLVVMVVGSILYGLCLVALSTVTYGPALWLMALAGGFSAIMYVPTLALLGAFAGDENKAAAVGAFNTIGTVGMVIGFPVIGRIADSSAPLAWSVAGWSEVGCCLVLLLLYPLVKGRLPKNA